MGSVDLFLEDEGQQYGNMEEAASVARTPATCLEVWSGDHRQTPGGLKKSKEFKAFRKKLTKRPLALRCQTQYIQAHDFGDIVMRYLDCPKDSFAWKLRQLLTDGSAAIDPAVGQFWHELIGDSPKKYVNIPSEKYIYVHKYVYICVYTYLCKMDENRSYAGLSEKWMSTGLMLACHKNG